MCSQTAKLLQYLSCNRFINAIGYSTEWSETPDRHVIYLLWIPNVYIFICSRGSWDQQSYHDLPLPKWTNLLTIKFMCLQIEMMLYYISLVMLRSAQQCHMKFIFCTCTIKLWWHVFATVLIGSKCNNIPLGSTKYTIKEQSYFSMFLLPSKHYYNNKSK